MSGAPPRAALERITVGQAEAIDFESGLLYGDYTEDNGHGGPDVSRG